LVSPVELVCKKYLIEILLCAAYKKSYFRKTKFCVSARVGILFFFFFKGSRNQKNYNLISIWHSLVISQGKLSLLKKEVFTEVIFSGRLRKKNLILEDKVLCLSRVGFLVLKAP